MTDTAASLVEVAREAAPLREAHLVTDVGHSLDYICEVGHLPLWNVLEKAFSLQALNAASCTRQVVHAPQTCALASHFLRCLTVCKTAAFKESAAMAAAAAAACLPNGCSWRAGRRLGCGA